MENDASRPLALVTGASSGIGFHLARLMKQQGSGRILATV